VRVLVLDDSPLLAWTVERLCPFGTEVSSARSFEEARRLLELTPLDAAVVSVPPATLPWSDFQRLCASREPPVPVLYLSCLFESTAEAGFGGAAGRPEFLMKPVGRADLEAALGRLLDTARQSRSRAG
jgi:DNA-binding response OmpR family regulator